MTVGFEHPNTGTQDVYDYRYVINSDSHRDNIQIDDSMVKEITITGVDGFSVTDVAPTGTGTDYYLHFWVKDRLGNPSEEIIQKLSDEPSISSTVTNGILEKTTAPTPNTAYTNTVTSDSDYSTPTTITILKNGDEMTTGYTYDSSTGEFTINADQIAARDIFTVSGRCRYNITVDLSIPYDEETNWLYNGHAKTATIVVNPQAVTLQDYQYDLNYTGTRSDGTAYNSETAPVDAGVYKAIFTLTWLGQKTYKLNDGGNGNRTEKAFTIKQSPITIDAGTKTKYYGQDDPEFTYSASAAITGETAKITGDLGHTAGEEVNNPNEAYSLNLGTLALVDNPEGKFKAQNYYLRGKSAEDIFGALVIKSYTTTAMGRLRHTKWQ
ncbi:MBG domain-containing protein [Eubacterium aggregans]|uniref:MBG domain-containing protein n=1 Tax=Eubacterium aggregans TaxID=81409 RepID=UPI003F2F88FF